MAVPARFVVVLAFALCAVPAASANAATTRFVSPAGSTAVMACTDPANPCALPTALAAAQGGDAISLADGSYNVAGVTLPDLALHWKATDPATRPLLTSAGNTTLFFNTTDLSGSTFDRLAIENTAGNGAAVGVSSNVDITLRSVVVKGAHCVGQGDGDQLEGEVTIVDSRLTNPVGRTCLELPPASIVRRSVISQTSGISPQNPPPVVETSGVVEDSTISGGLRLVGRRAVARRVVASGSPAISGEGLVVDSLAHATGRGAAAIAVDSPLGGVLRVVNATAISPSGPALLSADRIVPGNSLDSDFNFLEVTDTIARGTPDMRVAPTACPAGSVCTEGRIVIDHSNFQTSESTRDGIPNPTLPQLANQSGDPLFADAAGGDFHLLTGSPAIDAGDDPSERSLATDLDGRPRVRGAAVDIGAFEFSPPVSAPPDDGGGDSAGDPPGTTNPPGTTDAPGTTDPPPDTTAPALSLSLSRSRIGLGSRATLTATTSEAGQVTIALQRRHAGKPKARFTAIGKPIVRKATAPGSVKLTFRSRIAGRRLTPGRYRFVVTATDAAGNRSAPRTVGFRTIRGRAAR